MNKKRIQFLKNVYLRRCLHQGFLHARPPLWEASCGHDKKAKKEKNIHVHESLKRRLELTPCHR